MLGHLLDFIGRTHLVVLHFPIALIIVAAMVELTRALAPRYLERFTRAPRTTPFTPSPTALILIAFALLFTLITTTTGLVLGFDAPPKADTHRILGIVSAVLVLITTISAFAARHPSSSKPTTLYLTLLLISAAAVGLTGHKGGDLTHGQGFLTRPLTQLLNPDPEPTTPESEPPALNPADFNLTQASLDTYLSDVQPILTTKCVQCHGPDEAEQDLRLDTIAHTLDPSTNTIDRDDPENSDLLYFITLPPGDPDIMPPEDDPALEPLTESEIKTIVAWIRGLTG